LFDAAAASDGVSPRRCFITTTIIINMVEIVFAITTNIDAATFTAYTDHEAAYAVYARCALLCHMPDMPRTQSCAVARCASCAHERLSLP